MVKRLSLTIILTLPVCLPAFGADKLANPVAAQFHADKKACVEAITSGDLAKALINYAVAREDWEEARRLLEELELILPICVPDPTNSFERRRRERATMVAARARKGLEGDRISLMDMHDEAMAFYWPHFECQKILKHMQPWTREFPLDRLGEWDDATGAKIIDAHIHTYSALHWCGKFKEAEAGHRSIISLVPFGRFPKEVMTAFGRLGNALRSQGRYEEAKEVYETCLELDAAYAEDAWLRELPTDPLQRTLMGGMNSDYNRYWHVANYEAVLKEIEEKLKEGGE